MAQLPRLIGVIHLPPLIGSPRATSRPAYKALEEAAVWAEDEAKLFQKEGFEGLFLENFGDAPFYKDNVPAETIAAMSMIAHRVKKACRLPLGINVLRNDAKAAMAIAATVGAGFIRVNVLSGVVASDQGIIEGMAAELLRDRERLAPEVRIIADVHVKHARSLSSESLSLAIEEVSLRSLADAVILTGTTTGRSVDPEELKEASAAAQECRVPLYVGSGTTPQNVSKIRKQAFGVIVGSALRKDGKAGAPLESKRVRAFAEAFLQR